jgi:hypothetical protein
MGTDLVKKLLASFLLKSIVKICIEWLEKILKIGVKFLFIKW